MNMTKKKSAKECLEQMIPVMETTHHVAAPGIVIEKLLAVNDYGKLDSQSENPYIKQCNAFLQKNGYINPKTTVIVCEEEMTAKKAACYLYQQGYTWVDLDEDCLEWEDEDEKQIRVVDFGKDKNSEKASPANPYLFQIANLEESEALFFCCNTDMQNRKKLDVIYAAEDAVCYIWITKKQLQQEWVHKILSMRNVDVFSIVFDSSFYYEKLMDSLLMQCGYQLDEAVRTEEMIRVFRSKLQDSFCEEVLANLIDYAITSKRATCTGKKSSTLGREDFRLIGEGEKSAWQQLDDMTSLTNVKQLAQQIRALSREKRRNPKLVGIHNNMIFYGNPGSGKTTCALLLAQIMAQECDMRSVFVTASRKDIIGEYVGQTAPKVAGLFEKAMGGVLFIDEAGFFLEENTNNFTKEAIREFVRYMELYPQVTVIFALYAKEKNDFLKLDAGLSSRMNHAVAFPDYSNEELFEIAKAMSKKQGYSLALDCMECFTDYLNQLRKSKKEDFGNAREARKIVEKAIIAVAMRHALKKNRTGNDNIIRKKDMQMAIGRESESAPKISAKQFGFALPCAESKTYKVS